MTKRKPASRATAPDIDPDAFARALAELRLLLSTPEGVDQLLSWYARRKGNQP